MNTLLHIGLGNALMATVLAVLVAGFGRVCRRPALIHCLWVLVLVKLITPSLVEYRIPWPDEPEPALVKLGPTSPQRELPTVPTAPPELDPGSEPVSAAEIALPHELAVSPNLAPLLAQTVGAMAEPSRPNASPAADEPDAVRAEGVSRSWIRWVGAFWLISSATWFSLIACRIYRFHRLLRCARPASPELREHAQRLAERLGLATCPALSFVPGRVSPMVWALGRRPRLFLPSALWERLNEEQQTALLVHELAHLRRRDQWVRGLEFIVTGLYWWHPVVWWACREIREAEEECCDAWVVWALPRAAKAYAIALLETLDFLSETQNALPAVASGIGHVHDLRRRLTMIMRGTTPRALSGAGLLLVLGLGALLLPLLPTWAQGPRAAEEQRRRADQARDKANQPREQATTPGPDTIPAPERREHFMAEEREKARMEAEELKREVDRMQVQLNRAMQRLHAAQERLAHLQATDSKGHREAEAGRFSPSTRAPTPRREGAPDAERRLSELEWKLDALLQEVQSLRREMRRPGSGMMPGMPGAPGAMPGRPGRPFNPAAPDFVPVPPGASLPTTPLRPPAPAFAPSPPHAPAAPTTPSRTPESPDGDSELRPPAPEVPATEPSRP